MKSLRPQVKWGCERFDAVKGSEGVFVITPPRTAPDTSAAEAEKAAKAVSPIDFRTIDIKSEGKRFIAFVHVRHENDLKSLPPNWKAAPFSKDPRPSRKPSTAAKGSGND